MKNKSSSIHFVIGRLILVGVLASSIEYVSAQCLMVQDGAYGGQPVDVVVKDDIAYVAVASRITMIDLSDPSEPVITGNVFLSSRVLDLEISGDYIFVATYFSGIQVVDLGTQPVPSVVAVIEGPIVGIDLVIRDQILWFYGAGVGLAAYDISDPTNPLLMSSILLYANFDARIQVCGDRAFVRDHVFNISDPYAPRLVGDQHRETPFECYGEFLVTPWGGIFRLNENLEAESIVTGISAHGSEDVVIEGSIAYFGHYSIYDISDPSNCVLVGLFPYLPQQQEGRLAFFDHYLVRANSQGVYIADIGDPTAPEVIGSLMFPSWHYDLAVKDNVAYTTFHLIEMYEVDAVTGEFTPRGVIPDFPCSDVEIRGDRLYAVGGGGFAIYDVSLPTSPMLVGELNQSTGRRLDIDGNLVAISSDYRLWMIDISDETAPSVLSSTPSSVLAGHNSILGDIALKNTSVILSGAQSVSGLNVIDVSDAESPLFVDYIYGPFANEYSIFGRTDEHLYVSGVDRIQICDLRTTNSPFLVASPLMSLPYVFLPLVPEHLHALGNRLIGTNPFGPTVFDISDPLNPVLTAFAADDGMFGAIQLMGDRVVVASAIDGLSTALIRDCVRGDMNGDMVIDEFDIERFIHALFSYRASQADRMLANLNHDGRVDGLDVQLFVSAILN